MSGFFGGGGGSATTDAGDLTSGVLAHERGGLEADVSAYSGLLKIASGSTSQATAGTDYQAVLTGLADIPGSDKLAEARGGLGSLTGLIKATSGTASAAVAGTDYQSPLTGLTYTESTKAFSVGTYSGTNPYIAMSVAGLGTYYNVPTGDVHRFLVSGVEKGCLDTGGLILGNSIGTSTSARRLHVVDATNPQLRLDDGTYTCDMDVQNGALHLSFDGGSTWYSVDVTAV